MESIGPSASEPAKSGGGLFKKAASAPDGAGRLDGAGRRGSAWFGAAAIVNSTFAFKNPGTTPLFLAVRVRTLHLDVARGHTEVGLRIFAFWKSGLPYEEGTVLRQKHGEITPDLEPHIPDVSLMGKSVRGDDHEADRELKFHHLKINDADGTSYETDTMVTVFQYRTIEDIFHLEDFPFDEQQLDLQIRLPKSNAKDGARTAPRHRPRALLCTPMPRYGDLHCCCSATTAAPTVAAAAA